MEQTRRKLFSQAEQQRVITLRSRLVRFRYLEFLTLYLMKWNVSILNSVPGLAHANACQGGRRDDVMVHRVLKFFLFCSAFFVLVFSSSLNFFLFSDCC